MLNYLTIMIRGGCRLGAHLAETTHLTLTEFLNAPILIENFNHDKSVVKVGAVVCLK